MTSRRELSRETMTMTRTFRPPRLFISMQSSPHLPSTSRPSSAMDHGSSHFYSDRNSTPSYCPTIPPTIVIVDRSPCCLGAIANNSNTIHHQKNNINMCYTTGILKKQQQSSGSGSGGTGRIASSNSLQSLPKRAESPASSTSSSSSSVSSELLESEAAEFESAPATSTTNYNTSGSGVGRQFHASNNANGALVNNYRGSDISSSSTRTNLAINTHTTSHYNNYYHLASLLLVVLLATFVLHFSLWFPFVLPYQIGSAAYHTYEPAWYQYDVMHTKFDNTVWTYGTDYILTLVMCYLAWRCWNVGNAGAAGRNHGTSVSSSSSSFQLRLYSSSLLLCYGLSTLAGGLAHQYFTSLQLLNTMNFQWLWTVCVGNVAFASGYMGLIGREVQRIFGVKNGKGVEVVPLGPW